MKNQNIITVIIILAVIALAYFILSKPTNPITNEEIVKCIGENALLYTQLGCHACEKQEELFGDNYEFINKIDCFYEREKCSGIKATPTWIINGDPIQGIQTIEELQELTGC